MCYTHPVDSFLWYLGRQISSKFHSCSTRGTSMPFREVKGKVAQSCPTLCDPMDYILHGILQARILEWVAIRFSRGCYQARDRTGVSHIAGGFFTSWDSREAHSFSESYLFPLQWGLDHSLWNSGFSLSLLFLHFLEFPLTLNHQFLISQIPWHN